MEKCYLKLLEMKCKDTVSYFLFMNSSVGPIYSNSRRFSDGTVNVFKRFSHVYFIKYFDSEARRRLAIWGMHFQSQVISAFFNKRPK